MYSASTSWKLHSLRMIVSKSHTKKRNKNFTLSTTFSMEWAFWWNEQALQAEEEPSHIISLIKNIDRHTKKLRSHTLLTLSGSKITTAHTENLKFNNYEWIISFWLVCVNLSKSWQLCAWVIKYAVVIVKRPNDITDNVLYCVNVLLFDGKSILTWVETGTEIINYKKKWIQYIARETEGEREKIWVSWMGNRGGDDSSWLIHFNIVSENVRRGKQERQSDNGNQSQGWITYICCNIMLWF